MDMDMAKEIAFILITVGLGALYFIVLPLVILDKLDYIQEKLNAKKGNKK
jgi:hypothetical protein